MLFKRFHKFFDVLRSLWPRSAGRLTSKAARLRDRGRLSEAIAALDEAIRLDPRMAEAYAHRCACYCDLHEYAKAMEDANQAVVLTPEKADAYRWRAHAADALGQYELAVADLTEALRLDPEDPSVHYERSGVQCGAGDFRAALADLEKYLMECPKEAMGHQALASVRYHLGELDAALVAIEEAVRLEPKNGEFQFFRTRLQWKLGRLEEASAGYEAALAQPCEGKEEWRDMAITDQYWVGGQIALKHDDYREAIRQFDAALEVDPTKARLYYDRALAWHWLDHYENALRDMDEAVRLEPENEDYQCYRVRLLLLCERTDEAATAYEAVLERDPDAAEGRSDVASVKRAWLGGRVALGQGEFAAAIEQFNAALEAGERCDAVLLTDPTIARVYCDRGEAWYRLGEYEHALRDIDEAIRLDSDTSIHYANRASALAELGRYADAERDLMEATRRGPDCAHTYAYVALFRATRPEAELRDGRQAVVMAHKALELAGGPPIMMHCRVLAAAHAENGEFDEAVRWQTELLALVDKDRRPECEAVLEDYRAGVPYRGA